MTTTNERVDRIPKLADPTGYRVRHAKTGLTLRSISCKDCPTRLCDCAHEAWNSCKAAVEFHGGRVFVETFEVVLFESKRTAEYLNQLRLEKEERGRRNRRAA